MNTSEVKPDIIEYLKREGQHKDMVDISCYIAKKYNVSVDVPAMAISELEKENKIQRIQYGPLHAGYKIIGVL